MGQFRAILIAVMVSAAAAGAAHAQTVPSDPQPTCVVTPASFASWFAAGSPSLNGVVNPADSVTFPNSGNCSFYQWSEQMFLWMTSPAPLTYGGGGGRIFDSATFFDVSPPDASGNRTFIAHTPGLVRRLGIRTAQVGPHGLPIIFSKTGKLMEIEDMPASAVPEIRDQTGKLTQAVHARLDKGKRLLLDAAGQAVKFVAQPLAKIEPVLRAPRPGPASPIVRKFIVDKIPIFIDSDNNVIDTEEGQAGGNDVLMAQNGSKLIYYVTMSNDVFAYFLTGVKDGAITPGNQFPTTGPQLAQVVTFAAAHGRTFADPTALAIEAKSSWVEAAGLPNLSSYVTMTATIPTYNTGSSTNWTPSGQRTVQLAMLGLHVVGSAAGHPEMIWATFEHVGNTPNAGYSYVNTGGATVPVAQSTAGTWLFAATNTTGPFNAAHMTFILTSPSASCALSTICAAAGFTISPSNTIRWKAWGAASDARPNPLDASVAASNTEIISINDSVRGQLTAGDVRGNYLMIGSTWTIGGAAPNGSFSMSPSFNEVGTSLLNNSTMETYQQGTSALANPPSGTLNCFTCHTSSSPTIATTGVSHVFSHLQPLTLPPTH